MLRHTAHTNPLLFLSSAQGDRYERYELMVAFEAGKSGALWEAFHPPSGELLSDKSADALCSLWPWAGWEGITHQSQRGKEI